MDLVITTALFVHSKPGFGPGASEKYRSPWPWGAWFDRLPVVLASDPIPA